MNYFELFEIPVSLKVDHRKLSARFFALSRQFHPDYHAQADAGAQAEALEQSALLNKAWRTFQDPDATLQYVLEQKGLLVSEEKYGLAPDFLMEVMELNEALMELQFEPDQAALAAAGEQTRALQAKIYADVETIIEHYQEGVTSEKELLQVKEYYYRKKYLDRIAAKIREMGAGS